MKNDQTSEVPVMAFQRAPIVADVPGESETGTGNQDPPSVTVSAAPAPRNLGGRPTKYNAELRKRVLHCLETGLNISLTSDACVVSRVSLNTYLRDHPDFGQAAASAIALGCEKHLKKIIAASDTGDWRASAWWCERVLPSHFSRTRIEIEAVAPGDGFSIPASILDKIASLRAKQDHEALNGHGHEPAALLDGGPEPAPA